jgi:hypothetical protein
MKLRFQNKSNSPAGYLLTEALVYISVVVLILGIGYAAMYRSIHYSLDLRRSAEDIAKALSVGERWRGDIRTANIRVDWQQLDGERVMILEGSSGRISYRATDQTLFRKTGDGPWAAVLSNIKTSSFQADKRDHVTAWRWELELLPRAKNPRLKPLFTFTAVPATALKP